MGKLNVDGTEIQVLQIEEDDYISLTDMVRKIDNGPALIEKWVSPQFKLYLIKEFERLKKEEQALLGWSAKRELAKSM